VKSNKEVEKRDQKMQQANSAKNM